MKPLTIELVKNEERKVQSIGWKTPTNVDSRRHASGPRDTPALHSWFVGAVGDSLKHQAGSTVRELR